MREFLIPSALFITSHLVIFALILPMYAIAQ